MAEEINHRSISSAGQFKVLGEMVTARLKAMPAHRTKKAMAAISEQLFFYIIFPFVYSTKFLYFFWRIFTLLFPLANRTCDVL